MSPCPVGTVSEEVVSLVVFEKHGLFESFRTSDIPVINSIMERLKEIFNNKADMFRDGVDTVVVYSGMTGAYVAEYIDGCSKFFYRLDPETYSTFIESIGRGI